MNTEEENTIYIGRNQKIMVAVKTFNKVKYVDIRKTFKKDGKIAPTRKGICISQNEFDELKMAIEKIDKMFNSLDK